MEIWSLFFNVKCEKVDILCTVKVNKVKTLGTAFLIMMHYKYKWSFGASGSPGRKIRGL